MGQRINFYTGITEEVKFCAQAKTEKEIGNEFGDLLGEGDNLEDLDLRGLFFQEFNKSVMIWDSPFEEIEPVKFKNDLFADKYTSDGDSLRMVLATDTEALEYARSLIKEHSSTETQHNFCTFIESAPFLSGDFCLIVTVQ